MNTQFSLKELYDLSIKSTCNIEINGYSYEKGETIVFFDKIQIAEMKEIKDVKESHGGHNDQNLITWTSSKGINVVFAKGIFSTLELAIMNNAKLLTKSSDTISVNKRESLETDENFQIELFQNPINQVFVYDKESGERINNFVQADKLITLEKPYQEIIVDYEYLYEDESVEMKFGKELISDYLYAEGKTKVKDDITGKVRTGIFKIPKLKLMSALSMTLGDKAIPIVSQFSAIAYPDIRKGKSESISLYLLNDDIDSDM